MTLTKCPTNGFTHINAVSPYFIRRTDVDELEFDPKYTTLGDRVFCGLLLPQLRAPW